MSSLVISPKTLHIFIRERDDEIRSAINMYLDYINDKCSMDSSCQRCFIYDHYYNYVIIVFPLVSGINMDGFSERCDHIEDFEIIGFEIQDSNKDLLPTDCYPRTSISEYASDFLGTTSMNDMTIQEITINQALTMKHLPIIERVSNKKIVRNIFENWMEKSSDNYVLSLSRLELGSYLFSISKAYYEETVRNNIMVKVRSLYDFERIGPSSENIITDILKEYLIDRTVYCNGDWWHFEKGRWMKDGGKKVWEIISYEIVEHIRSDFIDDSDRDTLGSVIKYLGSLSVRQRLMKDLTMKLSDYDFTNNIDSRTNIIGLKDGTYDLDTGTLKEPLPSDYISLRCGMGYYNSFEEHDAKGFLSTLRQIFPNASVLRFFIRSCASMLEGYNKHKVFYIWWGTGNNAKTLLQKLVSLTLGEYSVTLPTSLITGRGSKSSEATPDMYFAKNKLVVFLQEPNPDEKIRVGKIKELTGNDEIYVREIYKSGVSMKFKAKIVIVTNSFLDAPGMDIAFRKRVVVIPFESTFNNDKKNRTDKYHFPLDGDMESKILKYRGIFLRLILREYQEFKKRGLEIPDYINNETSKYIMSNNHPLKYIRTFLSKKVGNFIDIGDIYEDFKEWFHKTHPHMRFPSIESLSTELRNEDYICESGKVMDISFK